MSERFLIDAEHSGSQDDGRYAELPAAAPTPHSDSLELEAIRKRCEAATAGPWEAGYIERQDGVTDRPQFCVVSKTAPAKPGKIKMPAVTGFIHDAENYNQSVADTEFIAHARSDIPALLSRLEAAERERDEWVDREAKVCPEDFSFEEVIAALRSENARMAEVLEAAREWFYVAKTPRARIEAQARIVDALEAMDAARASRTQSPDANPEKKQ